MGEVKNIIVRINQLTLDLSLNMRLSWIKDLYTNIVNNRPKR